MTTSRTAATETAVLTDGTKVAIRDRRYTELGGHRAGEVTLTGVHTTTDGVTVDGWIPASYISYITWE